MSGERCEKGVFVNGPTPNAPWCTEHDQPWEECYQYLRALLAKERRKREAAAKKLAEAVADFRERMSGRSRQYIVDVLIPQFLATLAKKEAEAGTSESTPEELLRYEEAWGDD